ncbi:GNAT family N-acetyltransferase [Aeromicrobium terrae]|uniref:N-acetyltransferase family protein n=1 Tax=Aeromicrobium terrae TaxID=2498846 RepID=A0A5C8NQE9_9ACTN|nr:GNAT family N-acetyltransferase [Aeromicrobium terrae]TXL63101.1 N-acetyltransferase family protein [Aeromicrobium terrae]
MTAEIRPGVLDDLPALLDVYNHQILTSHSTFDLEEMTLEQRTEWFGHYTPDGPHRLLVADVDGRAVGYATSSMFRAKAAYAPSVETSIYLATDATGQGIGRILYSELLRQLEAHPGLHRAYAGVALPNDASEGLHRALGFTEVGTYTEVGFKMDRYVDVRWYERDLGV